MISEDKFPDLAKEEQDRVTGILLAYQIGGVVKSFNSDSELTIKLTTLCRMIDGVFIDYQAARQAYYKYYQSSGLGVSVAVSEPLVEL